MIEINLLPESFYKSKRKKQLILIITGAAFVAAAVLVGLYVLAFMRVTILNGRIETIEAQQKSFEKVLFEIDNIKKSRKFLEDRKGSIRELQEAQVYWVLILDDFNKCIPNNLWLNSFTNKVEAGGSRTFSVDGIALFKEVVADFISNLNSSALFKNANLVSLTETIASGAKVYSFKLTFQSIEESKIKPPKAIEINDVSQTGVQGSTYINKEYQCSLSKTEGWNIDNTTALAGVVNILVVIKKEKKAIEGRFTPNVSLAVEKLPELISSKEYALLVEKNLQKKMLGYVKVRKKT